MAYDSFPGAIDWVDLTVPNAEAVRDFYQAVVNWVPSPHDMGDYSDYEMSAPTGETVAGVCHQRGVNAEIPTAWMVYILVPNLQLSLERVVSHGGSIVVPARGDAEHGMTAVVRDPAGAAFALFQPPISITEVVEEVVVV